MLDGRITEDAEYGQHIPLRCRNHPNLRWHTKNIDCIGARSIFFSSIWQGWEECDCPGSMLEPAPMGED